MQNKILPFDRKIGEQKPRLNRNPNIRKQLSVVKMRQRIFSNEKKNYAITKL